MLACDGGSADPPVLLTHAPGYLLRVEPSSIDLDVFTQRTERGRAHAADADWESARKVLREALDVWRGPVLADLAETCTAWPEAAAVQNAYVVAVEELFDAELACGRHREVIAELELFAARELSHERLVAQLMLAMYRCGRQSDALDVYRRARLSLIEAHGLEPSRELQELQHLIFNQNLRLDWHGGERPALGDNGIVGPPGRPSGAGRRAAREYARRARRPELVPTDGCDVPLPQGRLATVLAVVGEVRPGADVAETASAFDTVAATVDREVSLYGGVVISRIASVSWILFDDADHAPDRAVEAALAIRPALGRARSVRDAADGGVPPAVVKVAVVSTDAIHSHRPGDGTAPSRPRAESTPGGPWPWGTGGSGGTTDHHRRTVRTCHSKC
ncbi:hypothetical protein M271_39515 [Streptomyces rapamycinicus NRRL 5491]|uniref:Bacterial transcriptional activator domain-containing protein n=2 Tax=Streptomyces rapamycinicus TaxID=1226757 RepID=A0A0A0NPZ5_STRRN|nr:hypothetical protein M271_39515 [Streptomyces rapamycinicus NRRL 5491]MBB4787036.1 hypothetical protein [Streptomyces rapamycinicus]RLV77515.1 hypothetical protein D3C57_104060 [Streptomyces rapamycinicus NRRL 5491]